jgi:hypothetical protein
MHSKILLRTALLAMLIFLLLTASWEIFWRSRGFIPTFNDDKALWVEKRKEAYADIKNATVFIGSSRIKFDLDIPTWKKETGEQAIQLSLVGTSPILLLKDLAEDENFKGKLVVDVTEVLFFSQNPAFRKSAIEATSYYKKQSLSEKFSSKLHLALESKLAFLEERRFSLNTLLADLEVPDRPGVFSFPAFPKGFEWTTRDRQTYMSDMFLSNPSDLDRQTAIWGKLIMGDKTPPVTGDALDKILLELKTYADKIRARGGRIIFIRTPSSGPMEEGEKQAYPKEKYWDRLLQFTQAEGIHYEDEPQTAAMICPEWSHLSPADAVVYTKILARQLAERGWFVYQ